jgi:hypothetical protein
MERFDGNIQCVNCGSIVINDDSEWRLCDMCWRDAKIAALQDNYDAAILAIRLMDNSGVIPQLSSLTQATHGVRLATKLAREQLRIYDKNQRSGTPTGA